MYERTKKELNQKLRELRVIHDKENLDASLRFNSLQQQYKILKTQHDDLEQHCEKFKKDLATENDGIKNTLTKVQGQLTKAQSTKENDHQELLQLKYKAYQLEQENQNLRQKLHMDNKDLRALPEKSTRTIDKSFREQIPVSHDHYKIPISIRNKMVGTLSVVVITIPLILTTFFR